MGLAANNSFDGIEVVDFKSCLNFPTGTTTAAKRAACKPQVYRFRWPDPSWTQSNSYRVEGACHELEIYPDDALVCAGLHGTLMLNMKGAFDDNGTPADYTDDKLRGTPLPCAERETSTVVAPFGTEALVQDCTVTPDGKSLQVQTWLTLGAPSLEGVERLGTFHHMGFENQANNNFAPRYPAAEDIFVAHEAESPVGSSCWSRMSGAADPAGGATCTPGADNPIGNGGIHALKVDAVGTAKPVIADDETTSDDAAVKSYQEKVYAKDAKGKRAIYRAAINTEPQGSVCTSHVFQQIPGQNRIFMAWYSQGTQVVDFTENADGTIDFKSAGFFIPENANQWTSHVYKVQENKDGTFTYWGATGDFALGDAGRNAVDIYKVTLPAPPKPRFDPPRRPASRLRRRLAAPARPPTRVWRRAPPRSRSAIPPASP